MVLLSPDFQNRDHVPLSLTPPNSIAL